MKSERKKKTSLFSKMLTGFNFKDKNNYISISSALCNFAVGRMFSFENNQRHFIHMESNKYEEMCWILYSNLIGAKKKLLDWMCWSVCRAMYSTWFVLSLHFIKGARCWCFSWRHWSNTNERRKKNVESTRSTMLSSFPRTYARAHELERWIISLAGWSRYFSSFVLETADVSEKRRHDYCASIHKEKRNHSASSCVGGSPCENICTPCK